MKYAAPLAIVAFALFAGCDDYYTPAQPMYVPTGVSAGGEVQAPLAGSIPDIPGEPGQRVDENAIRSALAGYGEWQTDPSYGTVWYPAQSYVGTDFVPYGTAGHWVQTDAGFYWQSDYPFGWLTFHYGRWIRNGGGAWAWVPGLMFAPAWVDWRESDAYVGWAPLPPEGVALVDLPYAFCALDTLFAMDLWTRVLYGPPAMTIYPSTYAVAPAYGIGGAVYAWGPRRAYPVGNGARGPAMPIQAAWRTEVSPRMGGSVSVANGSGTGRPVGAMGAGTPAMPNGMVQHPMATAPGFAAPTTTAMGAPAPVAGTIPAGMSNYVGSLPVPRSVPVAGYAPGVEAHVTVPTPVQTYAPAVSQPAPVYHYAAPEYHYTAPAYSAPAYSAPVYHPTYSAPTYSAPAYHPSYSAPSYSAPAYHPTYSAPAYHPTYSAPAYHPSYSAPAYHPSFSAPRSFGGFRR